MKMAKILFDSDQEQESIFYQAKILNMGFVSSNENVNSSLLFSEPLNFKEALRKNPSSFRTFALQFGKRKYEESCAYKNTQNENQDFQTFDDIKELCKSLPSEWTVLQLCKDHDKFTTTSYKDQILERAQSIYVSILKHARSSEFPDPICFKIEAPVTKTSEFFS
ncbi:ESPL1 family protein [Megaselia abdita]